MAGNILPILLLGGGALLVMGKKKKKKKKKAPAVECGFFVDMNPMSREQFVRIAQTEWKKSGDPFSVSDVLFKRLISPPCVKEDFRTAVRSGQIGEGVDFKGMNIKLHQLYANIVAQVLEINVDKEGEQGRKLFQDTMNRVREWASQLTGESIP